MRRRIVARSEKQNVALERLVVEYVPTESVKPNDYNPNRQSDHDFELLCKSIDEDGFTQPIVALRSTRVVVDGEHRWRAAQTLGLAEVPVVFVDMTPAQARIATLRHNRARGEENVELAAAVLRDLSKLGATDWLKDSLMMDDIELQTFLEYVDDPEAMSTAEAERLVDADDDTLRQMIRDDGGEIEAHESVSVQDVIRQRESHILATKTGQDKDQVKTEVSIYKLRLVFDGEEGAIVKRVLGRKPVERLLEICRERAVS
jgi:ParB-like chromosome segregation protein Spo0J